MAPTIRCHYDVLGVARDADEKEIKKAHRKLALKFHPDKNYGDEDAGREFRLVQQAYECLSDISERKYYDQHREQILRGYKPGEEQDFDIEFIFDVTPFHFSGCYVGYGDGKGAFFAVYSEVFANILRGEKAGWVAEGNVDETEMSNAHLSADFGNGSSDWKDVSNFYSSWGSFSSCLSFAWADQYDPREAESRFVRRRMDDENQKARKTARKERNDEIVEFVAFVKRRDPRVKAAKEHAETKRKEMEKERKEKASRRKEETLAAREAWLKEREAELKMAEEEDLGLGRIRLADLDDDSDDEYYKVGRKGKKGKKKRGKKNKKRWSSSEDGEGADYANNGDTDNIIYGEGAVVKNSTGEDENGAPDASDVLDNLILAGDEELSDSSFEEPEPELWKCELCKKTFKSKAQFENHLNSKKHKETFKKWQKKNKI